jgi:hypothetical protein
MVPWLFGGLGAVPVTPPQSSKTMLRTLAGVMLSMVAMLGRPFGVGKGSGGKFMFWVAPETTMVASVIGYLNIPGGAFGGRHPLEGVPGAGHGEGKSKLCREGCPAGVIPFGKFESRYGETDDFISPELLSVA